jgi:hypothetical protein
MPRNGNITGEVFDDGVIKQIDKRQEFLGARYKTDKHLIFQNNQSSFLRLASSVNVGYSGTRTPDILIEEARAEFENLNALQREALAIAIKSNAAQDQLKSRGIDETLTGMDLAKACVLFGGTVGLDNNLNPETKFGIFNSNDDPISTIAAYGWGGISKGYVPFPGIKDAKIGFYNRGALQKAEVNIKVNSLDQLQIFDILYFRIGYTMLLEWGHNTWLDNEGNLKERNEFVTEPFEKFFTEGTSQQDIIQSIKTQRDNDSYNYDAMLGKVTNFSWKFNDDGSYNINLRLIGMGDIIESLKVNKSVVSKDKVELTPSQALNKRQANIDNARKAAEGKAQKAREKSQKASEDLKADLDKAQEKLEKLVKEYQDYYIPNNDVKGYTWVDNGASNSIDEFEQNRQFLNIYLDSSDYQSITDAYDALDEQWEYNEAWSDSFVDDEGNDDFNWTGLYGKTRVSKSYASRWTDLQDLINKMKGVLNTINNPANFDKVTESEAELDAIEKQNELAEKKLRAAEQRVNKEKEIASLSPVTSVENKNKTLFNLELYKWRQAARSGTGKNNYFKLNMTANSASPDSTGVSTLSLDFYYVRLGFMLEWIEKNLLIYDDTKKDPNSDSDESNPIFKLDYNTENNYCLHFPGQFSSDPTVCLIPSKYNQTITVDKKETNISWDVLPELKNYFVEGDDYKGKLMNVFVNIDHTASVLSQNVDGNGKVNLLKFLSILLKDINDCFGNVNKLEPVFDTEENLLKIIDANGMDDVKSSIEEAEKEANPMAVFQVYGIGNIAEPVGSFVTNVDFQVQLPPNMAAMATISAQAGGNIVGENATGLSKLNYGLEDRIVTTKLDKSSIEGAKAGNESPESLFNNTIQSVQKEVNQLYKTGFYAKDSVSALRSNNRDIALYLTGNEALKEKMPSPFFIPFSLNLDMQGLSGMRNYERFSITEAVLPYSYRSGDQGGVIDFLIKGISHKISDNTWTTSLETLTVSSVRRWKTKNQGKK